jgi:hypothetical protein
MYEVLVRRRFGKQMSGLLLFTASLFFTACLSWLVSVCALAIVQVHKRRQFSARNLMIFMTIAALTMAMAVTLLNQT